MAHIPSPTTSCDIVDEPGPKRINNRSFVACMKCHASKVKCTAERPKCLRCRNASEPTECLYPVRDRKISVSESYLNGLKTKIKELEHQVSPDQVSYVSPPETSPGNGHDAFISESIISSVDAGNVDASLEEDSSTLTDETQPRYIGEAACTTFGSRLHQYLTADDSPPPPRRSHYYKNQKLHRLTSIEYQLPNRTYARLLVRAVLRFIGPDYHLILRNSFLEQLDKTYRLNGYDDPIWLCRLFVVFALGELYSERRPESGRGVPGTGLFLTAMAIFQDLHEEPTIPYIETLLLISFYSNALNRRNTAYTYAGLALRLSLTLGLHRKLPDHGAISPKEREHRIRVFWTVYILDRVCSSKVGLPIMLRDEDVDVPLPSMDNLTEAEKDDFHDPCYINAQLQLAKITGNILNDIYRIPQPGRANTFVQSVQRILTSLWKWREALPRVLEFNLRSSPMYSSRSVASLHLNFSQCVILATRPIFFHRLRSLYRPSSRQHNQNRPKMPCRITDALSEACVREARTSSNILRELEVNGDLAKYGFFDALSVFSSTLILMMSSTMNFKSLDSDSDAVETSLNLLKAMRDEGNMPAHDYYEQLVLLKSDLDRAKDQMMGSSILAPSITAEDNGFQMLLAASGSVRNSENLERNAISSIAMIGENIGASETFDTGAALNNPPLVDFMTLPWTADSSTTFPGEDFDLPWNFDWENANLYGIGTF